MTKIAINGFGRIGRPVLKNIIRNHPGLEIVAINDLTDTKTLAHLLKYDSLYGRFEGKVDYKENSLIVNNKEIQVFAEKDPEKLPWGRLGVDVVLECTGQFTDVLGAGKHITAGAKHVVLSAPAKDEAIPGYVLGVNAEDFNPEKDKIVDMASCTTNCLAPMVKVLNDNFKVVSGFMTTAHSYTNDQKILDLPHKDLRRARAAAVNIIPTSTGAARAIGKVIPELKGKLDGISFRVPTPTVSILDLIVYVEKETSVLDVNRAFEDAANGAMQGILGVEKEPLVSTDFKGNPLSAIVDVGLTMVNKNMIKVVGWYDNEAGYATRLAEFAEFIGRKLA